MYKRDRYKNDPKYRDNLLAKAAAFRNTQEGKVILSERNKKYWAKKDKERKRAMARRASNMQRAKPHGMLAHRISTQVRSAAINKRPAIRTFDMLGYTQQELRAHIEKQFLNGMGWHNANEWHIDHIIPSSRFDLSDAKQVRAAWALTNLRPLWALDNVKKSDKVLTLL